MAGPREEDDLMISGGLHPTYVDPKVAAYREQKSIFDAQRDKELAGAAALHKQRLSEATTPRERAAAVGQYSAYQNRINQTHARNMSTIGRQGGEDGDFGFSVATPAQRPTGGGQAIAAEAPDQQTATGPGLLPFQSKAATAPDNAQWNVANAGRDGQSPIETAIVGNKQYWRTEGGVASKELNQQPRAAAGQSRPGHGLGMRDLGNGQVAVGQVGGFQNPGYGFVGNREDAARFFQPVPHGGGYNPYKQSFRTLFDEQMDARRAAQNAPSQAEPQGPMGWKRLRDQMNNESRERIADQQTRLGYSTAASRDALQQQQLAQQYGINMAQLGNDNLRTQAALGLSGLQQQQAQNQMAWDAEKLKAYQRMNDPRLSPSERVAARRTFEALNGGKENERKPERAMMELPDGTKAPIQYNDDGTYTRMTEAQTGGDNRDYSLSDKEKKAIAKQIPNNMKAAFERDPEGFMRHYAAIMGL